jgi:hypothetical protein
MYYILVIYDRFRIKNLSSGVYQVYKIATIIINIIIILLITYNKN